MRQRGSAIVIIIVIVAVLLAVIALAYFTSRQSQSSATQPSEKENVENNNFNKLDPKASNRKQPVLVVSPSAQPSNQPGVKTSPTAIPTSNWQTVKQGSMTIKMPIHWEANIAPHPRGGQTLMLEDTTTIDDAYPRVDVQMFKATVTTLSKEKQQLKNFGFREIGPAKFKTYNATHLSSDIPGYFFLTGNPLKKDVTKQLYLFETKGMIYLVDYAYYKDSNIAEVTQLLEAVTDTLLL